MIKTEIRPIQEVSGRGWRAAISPASADKRNFGADKAWLPATAVHGVGGDTERQPRDK